MKKLSEIVILLCCIFLFSCSSNITEPDRLYYAPYQNGNIGEDGENLIFSINDMLYLFDKTKSNIEIMCEKPNCSHEYKEYPQDNMCQAAIVRGDYIGTDEGNIYTATYNMSDVFVKKIIPYSNERTEILKFYNISYGGGNILFYNGYCYYNINDTGVLSTVPTAYLKRIPLTGDSPSEDVCRVSNEEFMTIIRTFQIYDNKIVMIGEQNNLNDVRNFVCIYDMDASKLTEKYFFSKTLPSYAEERVCFINENNNITVYDLEKDKIINEIKLSDYLPDSLLACDADYIYISQAPNSVFNGNEVRHPYQNIKVYNYKGELIDNLDVKYDKDPNSAVYMCSTSEYIFIGRSMAMQDQILFMYPKEDLGSGKSIIRLIE